LILLDSKFDGEIFKEYNSQNFIKYKITNITYTHKLKKDINYKNIKSIEIVPNDNTISVSISTKTKFDVSFAKLANGTHGLKFNIKAKSLLETKTIQAIQKEQQNQIDYGKYFTVIGFMAVMIVILLVAKRKMENTNINFSNKKSKAPNIDIIYQKSIDMKTKVSLVQIGNIQYLIMSSPNSYLLLDKFEANDKLHKENKRAEFDSILSANEKTIQDTIRNS
jgi:flagellar biogenesis protein FliO